MLSLHIVSNRVQSHLINYVDLNELTRFFSVVQALLGQIWNYIFFNLSNVYALKHNVKVNNHNFLDICYFSILCPLKSRRIRGTLKPFTLDTKFHCIWQEQRTCELILPIHIWYISFTIIDQIPGNPVGYRGILWLCAVTFHHSLIR